MCGYDSDTYVIKGGGTDLASKVMRISLNCYSLLIAAVSGFGLEMFYRISNEPNVVNGRYTTSGQGLVLLHPP